jgi:hypothetical protein
MTAFEYVGFARNAAESLYQELNVDKLDRYSPDHERIIPVFSVYYHKDTLTGDIIGRHAFMHPEDKYKNEDEIKYPFRDL